MRNIPITLINAVDTATQTGAPAFVGQGVAASITCVFGDTTAVGTIQIQGSNEAPASQDVSKYVPSNGSFNNIPNATSAVSAGVGPAIVLATMNFQYIRAVYTRTSGGSSTVLVSCSFLSV